MLNRLTIFFALLLSIHWVKGDIISLSGVYEGINLYVENNSTNGTSCMKEIFVNDRSITFEKNQQFFEIDMSFLKLKESVNVKIICETGCSAKVLNPEAINLIYGFQFMNISLEPETIKWSSTNEKPGGKYIIEMQVDKQWIHVGDVVGKPTKVANFYESKIKTVKNYYYRIKYVDKEGIPYSSKPVKFHK